MVVSRRSACRTLATTLRLRYVRSVDLIAVVPLILIGGAYLAAIVFVVVRIWRSSELSELERWVWFAAVVCFPLVSMLVWFVAGPHPFGLRITRDVG